MRSFRKKDEHRGVGAGFLSGVTWGLDTVLVGVVLAMAPFVKDNRTIYLAPFISAFLHDLFSALWMFIYLSIKGQIKALFKAVRTKSGIFIAIGALLGGPIGMTGYLLAVKYIGPAYTATISSLYPAIGAFFAFVFLKERLSRKGWVGLVLSIAGVVALGYETSVYGGHANYLLGFIFALLCAFGWGLECVICAYGMKDEEISPEQSLQLRQFVSALAYGSIIVPIIGGYSLVGEVVFTKATLLLAVTALSGTASYVIYYFAIHKIGAMRAMSLNITYAAWAIVFQAIILKTTVTPKLVICAVIIMFGSVLANYHENIENTDIIEV